MINAFRGDHHYLSNFFPARVRYNGIIYENNEAAFQAQKVLSDAERRQFIGLPPNEAKRLGRRVSLRKDWENVKDDFMYEIVRAKFMQNPELLQKLISTAPQELVEGNNWRDDYWGKVNGKGLNKLGLILMRVRKELS